MADTAKEETSSEETVKATVTFVAEDVQTLFKLTKDEADEWLFNNGRRIEDRMCELGWGVIETLGLMDNLTLTDGKSTE